MRRRRARAPITDGSVFPQDRRLASRRFTEFFARGLPSAPANFRFDSGQLTYVELNLRANQLAWKLRSLGAGPNLLVGVCAERLTFDPQHSNRREGQSGRGQNHNPTVVPTSDHRQTCRSATTLCACAMSGEETGGRNTMARRRCIECSCPSIWAKQSAGLR